MTVVKSQHPGLHVILAKLHRNISLSGDELAQFVRQVEELDKRGHGELSESVESRVSLMPSAPDSLLAGYATRDGTDRFASRSGRNAFSFYRPAQGVSVSGLGIGTYRGAMNSADDTSYTVAVQNALQNGINIIDTAINYRHQRSERNIACGIRHFIETNAGHRDEFLVCTKGGFLVPGAVPTNSTIADEVVEGSHCIAPAFLTDQIKRSRCNLGLQTIDVYYLHNPEMQLKSIGTHQFMSRMSAAFDCLEHAASDGLLRNYGIASWNGFSEGMLSLESLVDAARQVAGNNHRFRFLQLPFNLGMQDARTVLDSAVDLGITVIASASLLQGRLSRDLPAALARMVPGLHTDAQRAIHFARSSPGIVSALVGMRSSEHVTENLVISNVPPLTSSEYTGLVHEGLLR